MFLLISFVLANNYCVGNSYDDCKNICKKFGGKFDDYFNKIPTNKDLNTGDGVEHNIFISYDVDYLDTNHNLIFCDPSIQLIYSNPKTIKIKDFIYADSKQMPKDVSMLFTFTSENQITIEIETKEENSIKPFTLQNINNSVFLTTKFYTENFPENLISLSRKNSKKFNILEITEKVEKLFSNSDELTQQEFTYYCLSDKETKCEEYSNFNLIFIDYPSQIKNYPCFLIVDSIKSQILITNSSISSFSNKEYVHIIALSGSDITYYRRNPLNEGNFYVILHPDSIEMYDMVFEGEGKFTLSVNANISMVATSKINNNHFTLKTNCPFQKNESYIYALRDDLSFDFENKIQVSEYSLFYGPKCLSGLFESGKFLPDDEFVVYNVTAETLKETDFDYVTYYFKEGDHEIPKTWKTSCRFQGINPNETNFIFSDVYSYDGYKIDNFIDVNSKPSSNLNRITIKPARYFYLSSFRDIYHQGYIEKYTIVVENDFIMHGSGPSSSYDDDEISTEQCKIIGNGTIRFPSTYFMDQVKKFCQIDENVTLEPLNENMPSVYICLGQSDSEKCKSEIDGFESLQKYEWVWLRNIKTLSYLYSYNSQIYITGRQILFDNQYYDLILTPNSIVIVINYGTITITKNGIDNFFSQRNSAKLIVLFAYYDNYVSYYYKIDFNIRYKEPPSKVDLQIYFYFENVKLYMPYYNEYVENCIHLNGKCQIFIRKIYESRINIFSKPDTISFSINPDNNYGQICYSDFPIESNYLNDFVLCSNYEEFKQFVSDSKSNFDLYIFKDISLDLNTNYKTRYFYFNNKIVVSINLQNNASIIFNSAYFEVLSNNMYYFYYNDDDESKFVFDIKDYISLDYINMEYIPSISFKSSKESVEIYSTPSIMKISNIFTINVDENLIIYSPVPKYLLRLFNTMNIFYSKNWTYYHLSEEGKLLYESKSSILFDNFEEDDDLPENIVLAVGKDDNITIPLNWTNVHNFYIFQELDDDLLINKPLNLAYNKNSLTINYKFNIVVGNMHIMVPEKFTVNVSYPNCMYQTKLNCSENLNTFLYAGYVDVFYEYGNEINAIQIYGNSLTNNLTVISKSASELFYVIIIMEPYSFLNVKYRVDYDSICYCIDSDYKSKCSGNYFRITDVTTLLTATRDYPELTIWVFNDLNIPFPTGDHFVLDPKDEDITITVPDYPDSMMTTENETLKFNYSDSTLIEIINKSNVDVSLQDYLSIYIESNTNSSITFYLDSDVFTSIESKIDANFSISVETNSYSFYIEDMNAYENIFNGTLKSYIRVCAYDIDAASPCTYSRNETIDDVFRVPFLYNVVEIALSSKPHEIRLPPISKPINVNILPVPSSILTISTANSVQITPYSVIINENWKFEGDRKVLTIKLNYSSTLSVINDIETPITFQLTNKNTNIDINIFDKQSKSFISINKHGSENNVIIVFGTIEHYNNFINCLIKHEGIQIFHSSSQKYLCICDQNDSCMKCKRGISGLVVVINDVQSDPGPNFIIRVFQNIEMSSEKFNNEHNVYVDLNYNLNLTNVGIVNQNIENGLKVDNLIFENSQNLLLKTKEKSLNIVMKENDNEALFFSIEIDTYLSLNVININNKNIHSSNLYVTGFGELNSYDYPVDKIFVDSKKITIIKGIYIICNDECFYDSFYHYKQLGNFSSFLPNFDANSKIFVFLNSFKNDINVSIDHLANQKIQFIRKSSFYLLEKQNSLKFLFVNLIILKNDVIEVKGSTGSAFLDKNDSDLFVLCFDENLTIMQEDIVFQKSNPITIQPMKDNVTIVIDDTVDIGKHKIKIIREIDQNVIINIIVDKNISDQELLDSFFDFGNGIASQPSTPLSGKDGLPIGAIIGIVVGSVVLIAVVIVIIVFVVKRHRNNERIVLSEDCVDMSDLDIQLK